MGLAGNSVLDEVSRIGAMAGNSGTYVDLAGSRSAQGISEENFSATLPVSQREEQYLEDPVPRADVRW
jgi:hypothetical protein